tara:strand:- start:21133 stop:21267 length:135 start_codon:yes stop_codon:yes gene_type:complete
MKKAKNEKRIEVLFTDPKAWKAFENKLKIKLSNLIKKKKATKLK